MAELLNLQGLETQFKTREGTVHAVNGVSLRVDEGETLGIVGENRRGKSVTMMSMLRLIPSPPGKVVGWIPALSKHWYIVVYPGTAIILFVLAWNLVGDALRDILDPRMRGTGMGL
jgi:ABC-type uncharacterized transport system ATPase subunit